MADRFFQPFSSNANRNEGVCNMSYARVHSRGLVSGNTSSFAHVAGHCERNLANLESFLGLKLRAAVLCDFISARLTLERDGFAHFSRSPKACLGVARVALRVSSLPCVRAWSPRAGALFRAAPSVAARGEPRCYRVSIDPDGSGSARPLELTVLFFKGFNHF